MGNPVLLDVVNFGGVIRNEIISGFHGDIQTSQQMSGMFLTF